jgi:hypothetical protein
MNCKTCNDEKKLLFMASDGTKVKPMGYVSCADCTLSGKLRYLAEAIQSVRLEGVYGPLKEGFPESADRVTKKLLQEASLELQTLEFAKMDAEKALIESGHIAPKWHKVEDEEEPYGHDLSGVT